MSHLRFSQLITICIAVAFLGAAASATHLSTYTVLDPNSQDSVVLEDLLNGEVPGLIVGDKTFDEFFYSNLPGDDMPSADEISVFGFQDDAGHYGISLHGTFLDLPGGGPSDALLRFTVSVHPEAAERGYRISDAHLYVGGVGLGDDSFFSVDESFEQDSNETMSVFSSTLNGDQENKLSDWVFFDELFTKLRVTKDILAIAGDDTNQPVRTSVIDQSFSQEIIPEPATFGLLAIALMGIVAGRRQVQ